MNWNTIILLGVGGAVGYAYLKNQANTSRQISLPQRVTANAAGQVVQNGQLFSISDINAQLGTINLTAQEAQEALDSRNNNLGGIVQLSINQIVRNQEFGAQP